MKYIKLLLCSCILATSVGCSAKEEAIKFYYNGKVKTEAKETIEYSDKISFAPKDIGLKVTKDDKDVTKKVKYKKPKINKLKTYNITYTYEDKEFIYHMKVVDKSAPKITVEDLTIDYGSKFSYDLLKVNVSDNFDKDLSKQITFSGEVNTLVSQDYTVHISVKDSSGNEAKTTTTVHVKEKAIASPSDNKDNSSQNQLPSDTISVVSNPNSIQVLINKKNKLPENWTPSDLVSLSGNHYLRAEAASSFKQMQNVATAAGITMNLVSSYRTKEYQTILYNNYYATDPVNAPFYSALPRTSEHELGLAVDISYDWTLHDDLQNSALGQWMAANAHKYGWIMRYPYGKSDVTGYIFEAWHYRYVGVELATQLKNSGLTLEEYYS